MTHILAIDQGTTSSRAMVFDTTMTPVAKAQQEFPQHYPQSGWVEHDPEDIWATSLAACHEVISRISADSIGAIGITNQRETTLIWDRSTGVPIYNAIVWQDRRTAGLCEALKNDGHEAMITHRTGLLLDPYFSATKVKWLLDNIKGAREKATAGELAFGTVDSFLIWRLTGGARHVTDATNAARTMLYDIRNGCWDADICALLDIPVSLLPDVQDCAADFGSTDPALFGVAIPILGVAGDQQAATVGQACFSPGMMKSTYGTGCFALLNTGTDMVLSKNRLLTTIAYQFNGQPTYALEGSIFIAGAAIQWLRDGLGVLAHAREADGMAEAADPSQNLYLVPAFTGLGAPYWDSHCRGAIFGLTRNSGPNEFTRAALEAVAYQTHDLLAAMQRDWPEIADGVPLRVDGGMSASKYAMQFLADMTQAPVERPALLEITALGAAWLAGMQAGIYPDMATFSAQWAQEVQYEPAMTQEARGKKLAGWQDAVQRTLSKPGN